MKCLVADDEPRARERLRRMLIAAGEEVIAEVGDGLYALEQIEALRPEVVFLDVQMPELDGLGVAAALRDPKPQVVFVTAFDTHAVKAFELAAADYLVKPVDASRLVAALARLRTTRSRPAPSTPASAPLQASRRMAVRCGAKFVVFETDRVCAVLAKDHYSAILVDGKELLSDDSLDALEARFDPEHFLRVHRGGLVNLRFLKELHHEGDRKYVAVLSDPDSTRVPVSRERLTELKERLGID